MKIVATSRALRMVWFMAILGLVSCFGDDDIVSLEGVVQFVGVEGGCWQIAGNDGVSYEPINLREEFQVDGLAVRFKAKRRKDLASICMVGQIVEILSIHRLPKDK